MSEATTSSAPCSFPSRAALCCGTSWSSGSWSWIPNLQGVIFFCTSAQRSSLFCSPWRYDTVTTQSEMSLWVCCNAGPAACERLYLCLAGSSLQAAAGSGREQDFSKETMDSQRNTTDSQISRVESTHHQPTLTDLEKYRIWSRKDKMKMCYIVLLYYITIHSEEETSAPQHCNPW